MFVIFWRGWGFLVAVFAFGCSLIANLIFNAVDGKGYYDHHKWPLAISLIVSAALCWFIGQRLNRGSDRTAIDKLTGREFTIKRPRHTLFFIPMHWWGPILLAIALVLLVRHFVFVV
jgi:ABC-type Fe3+ transport system permease subunit